MTTTLLMPGFADHVAWVKLTAWQVREGDAIAVGAPLAVVDVDGQRMVVTSQSDGVILRQLRGDGAEVAPDAAIAILGAPGERFDWDAAPLPIRVRVLIRCDECGGIHPLNGVSPRAPCDHCGHVRTMDAEVWRERIFDKSRVVLDQAWGVSTSVNTTGGLGETWFGAMKTPPLCRRCHHLISWAEVEAGNAEGFVRCNRCAEPMAVRGVPRWLAPVAGRAFALVGDAEPLPPAQATPVVFGCPACGATLRLDGLSRIVRCEFCSSDVFLPDELWRRFHPVRRRTAWWILFER